MLDILQDQILTPATLERLLEAVNAELRARALAARPRVAELRKALTQTTREIANYTRAVGKGDFSSLASALGAAEQRRVALEAELAKLDGSQPEAAAQLTPAILERHLKGMTEKLRSATPGKVREAIQQSVARIVIGLDGSLTIEAKPAGLLGLETSAAVQYEGGPLSERDETRRWRWVVTQMA